MASRPRWGLKSRWPTFAIARQLAGACSGGIDVAFHVAGLSGIWGPWETYYGVTSFGTDNVIEGCRRHGVGRLVYTSSPSVTFDGRDQCGIDESAPYSRRWLCHYPHTKAIAEQHVLAANRTLSTMGPLAKEPRPSKLAARCGLLKNLHLRPHLIWGPPDRHLIPRLLDRARYGELRRVGSGKNLIDMIYVENAATAHLEAADALDRNPAVAGRPYFISQGEPVNCWKWIDHILALAGLPPLVRSIPTRVAWCAGAVLEKYHGWFYPDEEPRMTRFLAAQLGRSHNFNIARAHEDFGYAAKISTDEGMRAWGIICRKSAILPSTLAPRRNRASRQPPPPCQLPANRLTSRLPKRCSGGAYWASVRYEWA